MKIENHKSDCAQHNEPYMENQPCDCGADTKNRLIDELEATLKGVTELRKLKLIKEETFLDAKEAVELAISEIEYQHFNHPNTGY